MNKDHDSDFNLYKSFGNYGKDIDHFECSEKVIQRTEVLVDYDKPSYFIAEDNSRVLTSCKKTDYKEKGIPTKLTCKGEVA
jgi:hypothetical protein